MKTKQNESEFESEKKFRSIIESSPMGIHMYSLEADGKLIFTGANRAADKILGVDNSNFIGKTIEENFPPLAETEVPSRYREAALLGKNWQTEQIVYNDNKISGAFEVHAFQTSPGKMVTMFQDITERLKIESALKESEANLSSLINNKDESIWSIDSEYKYTTFNRFFREAYFESFNIKLQKGFDALEILSPELREFWKSKYDKALSGERIVFEFTIEISKVKKYFEVFLNPIFSDGNVKGVSALSVDITERKLAELALHESEEKHRTLFETMTHGIVYQNADGNIISANPAAERILGLTLDQMQGRTSVYPRWKAIHEDGSNFPGDDHPSMVALKTGKQVRNVVMGVFNPSTEQHTWININAVPQFKPGQKNPFQVYTTFEDITTAKLAEKELRKSEARLALVFNNTSDLQVLMRVESIDKYIIITVNQSFVNSLKLISPEISFENIIGKERNEFLNSFSSIENTAKEITMFRKAVSSKEEIRYEFDFHFNVSKVSLDIKLTPVLDKRGNCTHLLWNARDITARKRAEETLERERRDYHSILDAAPVMLAYKNKDDRFVRVNSAFANFVGLPIEKIIGKTTFDLVKQPDVAKRGREHDIEVINTGNPVINQLVKWSGFQSQKEIWALYSKFPFKDAKGNIIGTVSFILDVNDRVLAEKALCESELKFRSVFENSVDAIGVLNKGIHVFVNPAYLKLFGYNQIDDLCGKPIFDLIAQSEHEKILSYVNKRANEEDVPIEYHSIGLRKDGSEFLMNVHVTGYKLNDEKYTVAIIRDITHTQKIQEELTASELKFKTLTEKAPVGIFSTDRFGSTTYVNPKWCEISKMDFDKALGDGWLDAVHPEDRKLLSQNWQNASSHHEISQAEYRFIHPDGSIAWVSGQAVPQKDLDGNVIGYFGTIIDITEHKYAEERLRFSEEKFSAIFEKAPYAISLTHYTNRTLAEVNKYFETLHGFTRDEVLGKSTVELGINPNPDLRNQLWDRLSAGDPIRDVEIQLKTKSGDLLYCLMNKELIDIKGEKFVLNIAKDITKRKKAEEELIRKQKELQILNSIILKTSESGDLNSQLQYIMDEALKLVDLEGGTICLLNPDNTFKLAVHRETTEDTINELTTHKIKIVECLCGNCAKDCKPLILWNKEEVLAFATHEVLRGEDIHFHAAFPFVIGSKSIGVLCVFTRTDKKPGLHSLKLLETIVSQTAILIDRSSLFDEVQHNESQLRTIFENVHDVIFSISTEGKLITVSPSFESLTGWQINEWVNKSFLELIHPDDIATALNAFHSILNGKIVLSHQLRIKCKSGEYRLGEFRPSAQIKDNKIIGILGIARDVTERKRNELLLEIERKILEMISKRFPLSEILEKIVLSIEEMSKETIASILLLGDDGIHVHYGAAPNLPDAYNKAIEGEAIGDRAGSCGTAMFLKQPVIVSDIENDPLWKDYKDLAKQFGLRACWSAPIFDADGNVFGSFAMYYKQPRIPNEDDLALMKRVTYLVAIALQNKKAEEKIINQLDELHRWQKVMIDREQRNFELKQEINELLKLLGKEKKYRLDT